MQPGSPSFRRSTLLRGSLLAAAACAFALASAGAAAADPVPYTVEVCTASSTTGSGVTFRQGTSTGIAFQPCGNAANGGIGLEAGTHVIGRAEWVLEAPPGATIHDVEGERVFESWTHVVDWELGEAPEDFEVVGIETNPAPAPRHIDFAVQGASFSGAMECPNVEPCAAAFRTSVVTLKKVVAHMEDLGPPVNLALAEGPLGRGTVEVPFEAEDEGSGIAKATLLIDGQAAALYSDSKVNKHCVMPFRFLTPCSAKVKTSFSLDTTAFADGDHNAQLVVEDATGQVTTSAEVTVSVHNAPVNTKPPTLSGAATVGSQLSAVPGTWEGSPTFAYQWLRCPASVTSAAESSSCTPIPGQGAVGYTPSAEDISQRDMAMVTATNAKGSVSVFTAPSAQVAEAVKPPPPPHTTPPDTTPPLLSGVSLSRKRFPVAAKRDSAKARKKKGTVLRLTSSEAASLSVKIERVRRGHKPKGVGTLSADIGSGPAKVAITGKVAGGKKPLAPGSYRMTITARDAAGNISTAVVRAFRVLPG